MHHLTPSPPICSLSCIPDVACHIAMSPLPERIVYTLYVFSTFFLPLTFFLLYGKPSHLPSVKFSTMYPLKRTPEKNVACHIAMNPLTELIVYTLYTFPPFFSHSRFGIDQQETPLSHGSRELSIRV